MKKQLLFIIASFALSFNSTAQEKSDLKLIPCVTYEVMDEAFKANANLKAQYNLIQSQLELEYKAELAKNSSAYKTAAFVYTVPVVFHVMGPSNVSDQVFENLINYINSDYGRMGSDVGTIHPAFAALYVDADIRFALAKKDPDGNCTNGIIRHNTESSVWSQTSPSYNYSGSGPGKWATTKYLNIYVVDCISGPANPCPPVGSYVGGYTYLPGTQTTSSGWDAIVVVKNLLGQSNPKNSRTLSHEIGHWLNLNHTFGSTNSPGSVSCGNSQLNDFVGDTPETKGYFGVCPNSYPGDCTSLPNIENIMDYSSCPKMFTQGQITRMRSALVSNFGSRNNLWSPTNLLATGVASNYSCLPIANFQSNRVANCVNNTVTFTDLSQIGSSGGGVSWTFQGGTPSTSSASTQVVSYATPGSYFVSLTATNPSGSNTMNKVSYINIINGAGGALLPAPYDFQGATLPSNLTVTNVNIGSPTWIQNNLVGGNATNKSIFINNASSPSTPGHIDIFETDFFNFTNTININFSFYYAYAKRVAAQADSFKVQYSLDCGGSWTNMISTPTPSQMAAASGGTTTAAFVPNNSQFILKSYVPAFLNAVASKPSVKFRFWFKSDAAVGRSNNIYIDQINITGDFVTSISELEKSMQLSIYPNPTSSAANIEFTVDKNQNTKISVQDIMGRVLEEDIVNCDNDGLVRHIINQNGNFASGVYIFQIEVNNQRVSKKLIIK